MPRQADHTMRPGKGDAESVRHIPQTDKDREEYRKSFREQKRIEQEHKERRFAEIRERRKGRPPGSGGTGINIEVTSDK